MEFHRKFLYFGTQKWKLIQLALKTFIYIRLQNSDYCDLKNDLYECDGAFATYLPRHWSRNISQNLARRRLIESDTAISLLVCLYGERPK